MPAQIIIERTEVRYRGLPVTVVGRNDIAFLAIAGYQTPMELALGSITTRPRGGGYRVHGHRGALSTLAAAAAAIANHREANDHAAVRRQTRGATGPGLHEALDV